MGSADSTLWGLDHSRNLGQGPHTLHARHPARGRAARPRGADQGRRPVCLVRVIATALLSRNPLHAEYVWHENPHWHYFTLQYDSGGGHTSLLTRSGLFESQGSELQVSSRARWRLCEELIGRVVS